MTSEELARLLLAEYREKLKEGGDVSQQLLIASDIHDIPREMMLEVGRKHHVYARVRVYRGVIALLVRHLSRHPGVHIPLDIMLEALQNLAHSDDPTGVIGKIDRFINVEEGDSFFYQEAYEYVKKRFDAFQLSEEI